MTSTPPGWYDDGHGVTRWWDGQGWTEHVQPPAAPAAPEVPAAPDVPDVPSAVEYPAASVPPWHPEAPASLPAQPLPVPPPASPSSKGWVLPVVIAGAVVLLFVVLGVLAAILIPVFLNAQSGSTTGGALDSEDESVAVDVVERYDDAWDDADCDAYFATTTEAFRMVEQITECDQFVQASQNFTAGTDDYELEVTAVEASGEDRILVFTAETYVSVVDENGEPTDPQPGQDDYRYTLIREDAGWYIDDVTLQ